MDSDKNRSGLGIVTPVTLIHIIKFVFRTSVFLFLSYDLISDGHIDVPSRFAIPVSVILVIEILSRFFPTAKMNSIGALKHLKSCYEEKNSGSEPKVEGVKGALAIAVIWIFVNGILIGLVKGRVICPDWMILLCSFYSVCDMICVLFLCPLQLFFMKNRCCVSCRIYNWDYIMMVTPLMALEGIYPLILICPAMVLFLYWEINYKRHPERYGKNTNGCLDCKNCNEKICQFRPRKLP